MGTPAREIHEIVVTSDRTEDARRLLGVPVHAGDRVRFEVVEEHVSPTVPQQRRARDDAPDSARFDPAWREWLQQLDGDDAVTPDVSAVVELARTREQHEV